jgi:glucose/arabinose dehydrogenase/PKD repeat protein
LRTATALALSALLALPTVGALSSPAQAADAVAPPVATDFDQITLAKGAAEMGEPMNMAVLPDGSVLHTARDGRLFYTASAGTTTVAATLNAYTEREDGLQGVAIDPNFAENGWVYLYYAPRLNTPLGEAPHDGMKPGTWEPYNAYNQLSRFKFADGKLDLTTEQKILTVEQDRGMCCHNGGDIDFDADGNLYLSTGDDSDPFESDGYAPIDDRVTRAPAFDARRSAGNSNDLRGKILRIHMNADGTYTSPAGNLFPEADDPGDKTRPEIYAMGFRNPFRMSVDKATGIVYVGDYGPDAGSGNPNRGPGGQVEFNRVTQAGNFGWPYCTGTNTEYETFNDYDFATKVSGPKFDCANGPTNDSALNDGLTKLPPAQASWIKYGDQGSPPEFGGGSESPMGGPVYRFDASLDSDRKWPEYFDGKFFAYEFGRQWIKTVTVNEDGSRGAIEDLPADIKNTQLMDLEFGPDGALYVLDYGTGYFNGDANSALYRIDYVAGGRTPTAVASGTPTSGMAPLEVKFSSEGTHDLDTGDTLTYAWDFGDGATSTEPNPTHTYTKNGDYVAKLTATDSTNRSGVATVHIAVGNTAPVVKFVTPVDGQIFTPGEKVPYKVEVSDPDGMPVDCSKVSVLYALGHDQHSHGGDSVNGCEGTITTGGDASHGTDDNIFGILLATFTDVPPTSDAGAATTTAQVILQPAHRQAEHFGDQNGIQIVTAGAADGGARIGYIDPGDWVSFNPYNLTGVDSLSTRISAGGNGGTIEFRSGAVDGPIVATVVVPNTGSPDNYLDLPAVPVTDPGGTHKLFLVFKGNGGGLFDVDSFTFHKSGDNPCVGGPMTEVTDNFDGTALDRDVWTKVVRENSDTLRVTEGTLILPTGSYDMYGGNTNGQNLVLQKAPAGAWTATSKVTISPQQAYQQAGMMVYGNDQNFAKLSLIRTPDGLGYEFIRQANGTPDDQGAVDRLSLPADYPSTAWVRISSDGSAIRASVSTDGQTFTPLGRPHSLAGIPDPHVGLFALNGGSAGVPVIDARFDSFTLASASGEAAGPDDQFDGDTLNQCRWTTILREDPAHYRVTGGNLEIDALDGDMYGGNSNAKNVILQNAPAGGWEAITKVSVPQGEEYEQGGLIVHASDGDYAKAMLIDIPGLGWRAEFGQNVDGNAVFDPDLDRSGALPAGISDTGLWLKVTSDGNSLTAAWSADGETWTTFGRTRSLARMPAPRVGLAAFNGNGQAAKFDFFDINEVEPEPICQEPTGTADEGYRLLFDGTQASLDKWKMAGPGGFTLQPDCTIMTYGGLGLLYYPEAFDAYSLQLDWKMAGDDNSGVFVGFPDPGNDPWSAVDNGHEIQIDATDDPSHTTGSIYGFKSADEAARDAVLNPPGEWNHYEIVVEGDHIQVILNGVKINDYVDTDPNRMNSPSFIGLQNHGNGDDVFFRNIQIKPLEETPADTTAPTVSATLDPAAPNGNGGFYTSPVTVTLTGVDESPGAVKVEYKIDGAANWTTYTAPFQVGADGAHTVTYRATDAAGNVSEVGSSTVKVDATKPAVNVLGVAGGGSYAQSDSAIVSFTGTDAGSGMGSTTATLDGNVFTSGTSVNFADLSVGEHVLVVTSTDVAGNVTTTTVTFTVTAVSDEVTFDSIRAAMDSYATDGRLAAHVQASLLDRLNRAELAAERGSEKTAINYLEQFVARAKNQIKGDAQDIEVRDELVAMGEALIAHYRALDEAEEAAK